ncbi:MAG: glycosyltransferase [Rhodothalassiaceae bacterium]
MEGVHDAILAACWIIGGLIALSGLDDLCLDLIAHGHRLARRLTVYRRHARATCDSLPVEAERPAAILVPAWREEEVIGAMLRALRKHQRYRKYRVFLGTYANDAATAGVARACDPDGAWLSILRFGVDGPTTKADCLNRLWHAVGDWERDHATRFAFIVLHDAEDIVHPDELRIFNRLTARADMVQLPVQPLVPRRRAFIAGHYLDEFAESHHKDLVVREWLGRGVPSAGVGCAFRADALRALAREAHGGPFSIESLTEDYALSLTLQRQGKRTIFVRLADATGVAVATREYFPDSFAPAVRQKARWLIGIGLQAWAETGWPGSPGARYMLLRDRKAIASALLSAAAYLLALAIGLYAIAAVLMPSAPPLLEPGGPLGRILGVNLFLLANRAGHRLVYVWRLAGPIQGLLSLPRIPLANAINCAAALRALRLYARHRLRGAPLHWDKTPHRLPIRAAAE